MGGCGVAGAAAPPWWVASAAALAAVAAAVEGSGRAALRGGIGRGHGILAWGQSGTAIRQVEAGDRPAQCGPPSHRGPRPTAPAAPPRTRGRL